MPNRLLRAAWPMALVAILAVGCIVGCRRGEPTPSPRTFVLVHGAWQAPYAWNEVKADLIRAGERVVVVELAGHGSDSTDPSTIRMDTYRDQVVKAIKGAGGKVELVGHSLAGMVITAANEVVPDKIDKLIYLTCFIPSHDHPTIISWANTDSFSLLGPHLQFPGADAPLVLGVDAAALTDIFIQDGTASEKQLVVTNYRPDPLLPFLDSVNTGRAFERADKYYIHTLRDHLISPSLQNRMVAAAGIKTTYAVDASHCAAIVKPDSVAALLLTVANSK